MDIDKAIETANEQYQSGNLIQAEFICRDILKKHPANVDAMHLLGVICYQSNNYDSAILHISESIRLNPSNSEAYYNLGNSFRAKGDLDEAITCYQKALQINRDFVEAHFNLGITFHDKGRIDKAITCYQKAVLLNPEHADAYYHLGTAYQGKNLLNEALISYQKSLQLDRDNADAYHNVGYIFQTREQFDDAIIYFKKALNANPKHTLSLYSLGIVFHKKGRLDEAATYYQRALELDPNLIAVYYYLGTIFQGEKQLDKAIICYKKAIDLNPDRAAPYYSMGVALQEQGKINEALNAYDKAIKHNPSFVLARWVKCMSQIPIFYPDQSSIESSRELYQEELIKLRDTISLNSPNDISLASEAIGQKQPFFLAYQGLNDRELQKMYGELVCKIMSAKYPQFAERPPMPLHLPGEPLRIGVVSGFFYYHASWKIPIKGWIENIDKNRFRLFGYYTGKKKDKETAIARQCFSRFVEDVHSFEELCEIILNDNLHVLIYSEIGMNPISIKLAALRLSPVQCASWGHPETSGLPTIDYFLSSDLIEPPDAQKHYTEQLIRLPKLSFYYSSPEIQHIKASRETLELRPKSIVYHCFQSLYKFLPQYDDVFPKIAQQAGDCQFLFVSHPYINSVIEQFQTRINWAFDRFHLDPNDYVVFLPPLAPESYQSLNYLSDIFLDPIGWSGCNSVLEALSCNLPVVTLPTKLMRGREGSAILTMMGVTETIAATPDDYIMLAAKLGKNPAWRKQISDKIAAHKHLVYRDKICIKGLENFLEQVVNEKLKDRSKQKQ